MPAAAHLPAYTKSKPPKVSLPTSHGSTSTLIAKHTDRMGRALRGVRSHSWGVQRDWVAGGGTATGPSSTAGGPPRKCNGEAWTAIPLTQAPPTCAPELHAEAVAFEAGVGQCGGGAGGRCRRSSSLGFRGCSVWDASAAAAAVSDPAIGQGRGGAGHWCRRAGEECAGWWKPWRCWSRTWSAAGASKQDGVWPRCSSAG